MDSGSHSVELVKRSSVDEIFVTRAVLPLHRAECLYCFPAVSTIP